jgi:hypothetical protein
MNMSKLICSAFLGTAAALVLLGGGAPVQAQESKCPALSNVEWWTNTVPEVRRVVLNSYDGKWEAYIDRWRQELKNAQDAYDGGSSIEIKSRGLVLRDDDLKSYVGKVDERIKTLSCLAKEYGGVSSADLGGQQVAKAEPKQDLAPAQKVEAIEGAELNVEVAAICDDGKVNFQITNLGDRWPRLAEISIFRTDTNAKLVQRRVRMTNSQQMIFKLPEEQNAVGEVGIFVEPQWYERKFAYDAKLSCK